MVSYFSYQSGTDGCCDPHSSPSHRSVPMTPLHQSTHYVSGSSGDLSASEIAWLWGAPSYPISTTPRDCHPCLGARDHPANVAGGRAFIEGCSYSIIVARYEIPGCYLNIDF